MQIGSGETLPAPRIREGAQHSAVAAADFQIASGVRKEAIGEADDQLVTRHEPEMRSLDLGERGERDRIEAADGVSEFRCKYRNPPLSPRRHCHMQGNANPGATQVRSTGSRLTGTAGEAKPLRGGGAGIHRASALTVTPAMMSARPSSWIAGSGSPNSAMAPSGTKTKLSAMIG